MSLFLYKIKNNYSLTDHKSILIEILAFNN